MDKDNKGAPNTSRVFVLVVVVVGIILGVAGFMLGFWMKGVSYDSSKCILPISNDGSLPPVPPEPTRPAK